ncbi:MAG TPA: ATP-binding protein [Casimicrobiaceae bacterium]|nr:ATP-binding protein [Casimicrobiaceae bacterium]
MNRAPADPLERRLLVLAPIGKDASLIGASLEKDAIDCVACKDLGGLLHEIARGAGAVLVAEEALADHDGQLAAWLTRQPPWSDLPVLLLTRAGADSATASHALRTLGNVTLLERPVRISTLLSAVRSALRARGRQYRARASLEEREEADRRKNQFLAMLAHELRNPLAPIVNSLALLRLTGASQASASTLEIINRQVEQMVRLVDDLMDVSRITSGKIELRKETVDLADVVASAVETSRPLIDAAGHALDIDVPVGEYTLDADRIRIAQVFSNLLNNAAKYTDPGGHIAVVARREDDHVAVTVSDTGVGIPADSLPRVFDMFTQVNARDHRSQSGLGIGLTLVRSIVEMHGGDVAVTSGGKDKGSAFTIRLPIDGTGRARAAPPTQALFPPRQQERILVVDDNVDAADTLGALLKMLGADTRVVYDGATALGAIDEFAPDVVMLDLGMPGMDGYEVARRIRARSDLDEIVLIALTGWGQTSERRKTSEAGFAYHLVKPISASAMDAILRSLRDAPAPIENAAR